jgi:hypothetical protein
MVRAAASKPKQIRLVINLLTYAGIENAILDPSPRSPRLLALAADGLRALDRHWRNVNLASHNPSSYKQQVLGGYEVHGTKPPLDVYF